MRENNEINKKKENNFNGFVNIIKTQKKYMMKGNATALDYEHASIIVCQAKKLWGQDVKITSKLFVIFSYTNKINK